MHRATLIAIVIAAATVGCGGGAPTADPGTATGTPTPAADPMSSAIHDGSAVNTDVLLSDEIRAAWGAIKVRVVNSTTGEATEAIVPIGASTKLDDTGLTLEPLVFVPAFVMDDQGITSSSADPTNPAARVRITEDGMEDYEGWLFAATPEIHPFPHATYSVVLVEGVEK